MAIPAPEVQEFCDKLTMLIKRLGPKAFGAHDLGVLYSGPSYRIKGIVTPAVADNVARSAEQAGRLGAVRIDETHIGKLLIRADLPCHFQRIYGANKRLIDAAIFDVWACASREFVKASFKHAVTAVCGADPDRVFREHELKVILTEPTAIETINGISIDNFKNTYQKHSDPADGFYAAYVEICQTELDVAHQRALTAPADEKDAAWEDYSARKMFFDLEQEATSKAPARAVLIAALTSMTVHKAAIAGAPHRPILPMAAGTVPKVAH